MSRRLLITLGFPPTIGGMQSYLYERCKASGDSQMTVLAPKAKGCEDFDAKQSFEIYRWSSFFNQVPVIKRISQIFFPLFYALAIYCRQGFDVVECGQALPFGLIGLIFEKIFNIPYIVWAHGNDILKPQKNLFLKLLLLLSLRNARAIVANSQSTKQELVKLGLPAEKVIVINPPVDTERFNPDIDCSEIVAKHHLGGKKVLLTVGRLVERKGIDTVIESMPKVIASVPDVVYLIIGDGDYRNELEDLVERLGLSDRIIFAGHIPDEDLPQYYSACDLFIMVSRVIEEKGEVEGFGIVYLEAGACGKPVIGGRGGGISDAIENGVTGLLVNPLDKEEIANVIIRLLKDEKLAKKLGEKGREKAKKQPDWSLLEKILQ